MTPISHPELAPQLRTLPAASAAEMRVLRADAARVRAQHVSTGHAATTHRAAA